MSVEDQKDERKEQNPLQNWKEWRAASYNLSYAVGRVQTAFYWSKIIWLLYSTYLSSQLFSKSFTPLYLIQDLTNSNTFLLIGVTKKNNLGKPH